MGVVSDLDGWSSKILGFFFEVFTSVIETGIVQHDLNSSYHKEKPKVVSLKVNRIECWSKVQI